MQIAHLTAQTRSTNNIDFCVYEVNA